MEEWGGKGKEGEKKDWEDEDEKKERLLFRFVVGKSNRFQCNTFRAYQSDCQKFSDYVSRGGSQGSILRMQGHSMLQLHMCVQPI